MFKFQATTKQHQRFLLSIVVAILVTAQLVSGQSLDTSLVKTDQEQTNDNRWVSIPSSRFARYLTGSSYGSSTGYGGFKRAPSIDSISGMMPFGKRAPSMSISGMMPISGKRAMGTDMIAGMMPIAGKRANQASLIGPLSEYINLRPLYYRQYNDELE